MSAKKTAIVFLFALMALHLLVTLRVTPPTFLISDEITYFRMAHGMANGHGLAAWNGYEEFPTVGFVLRQTSPMPNHIYPKYPSFYALVAAPFQMAFGIQGLFVLNALAFLGTLWLSYLLGRLLSGSKEAGILSAITLAFGTYFWIFSQAIWPHALTTFFVLGALYATAKAWVEGNPEYKYTLLAGLSFSAALAIRYDSLLIAPLMAAPFLYGKKIDWKALGTIGITASLGLIFLIATNFVKFGTFNPFTYGNTLLIRPTGGDYAIVSTEYLRPFIAYCFLFFPALLWARKEDFSFWPKTLTIKSYSIIWLSLAAMITLAFPEAVANSLDGLKRLIIDLSTNSKSATPNYNAQSFSENGAMLFDGAIKRALLPSAPIITLGLLPFLLPKLFSIESRQRIAWLWGGALVFILMYGIFGWHGGYGYNLRYFAPCLPLLAVAASWSVMHLLKQWKVPFNKSSVLIATVSIAIIVGISIWLKGKPLHYHENTLLNFPLFLALVTPALCFFGCKGDKWLRKPALVLVGFCIFWGGITAMILHYPLHNTRRQFTIEASQYLTEVVAKDAMIIAPDWQAAMLTSWGWSVRKLIPNLMKEKEMLELLDYHFAHRIPFYIAVKDTDGYPLLMDDLKRWGYVAVPRSDKVIEIIRGKQP